MDTLKKAEEAYALGNIAEARESLAALIESQASEEREGVLALRHKVSIDPVQAAILVACFAFYVFIVVKYLA